MSLQHLTRAIIKTLQISVPTVLEASRGELTPERCDERLNQWSRQLIEQAKIRLLVEGRERMPHDEVFIVMSNHQSLYDIPVIFQALQRRVRMVAKAELFRIPIWNRAMRSAGFVELDRGDRERAIASLARAEEALQQGTCIWIAPEGTRSLSGRLGEFKKGGFHMALATGTRILPVTISGTRDVLNAKGLRVQSGATVRVHVSDPIDPKAFGEARKSELIEAVRAVIAAHLPPELR